MDLVWPHQAYLPGYVDALRRGWSQDTQRADGLELLAQIEADPDEFVAAQIDREGKRPPITLPDGSLVPRLPGYSLWMWDGEFAGQIGFRWKPGTTELPPYCLGHIGYGVVPWKQGLGYATRALSLLLPIVKPEGLPFVELTTNLSNVASQRVITKNGGVLVEQFRKIPEHGGGEALRFRIHLE